MSLLNQSIIHLTQFILKHSGGISAVKNIDLLHGGLKSLNIHSFKKYASRSVLYVRINSSFVIHDTHLLVIRIKFIFQKK